MVQTMGNRIPGGESGGLFNEEKVSMLSRVSKPAIMPTSNGMAVKNRNVLVLDCIISPPIYSYEQRRASMRLDFGY